MDTTNLRQYSWLTEPAGIENLPVGVINDIANYGTIQKVYKFVARRWRKQTNSGFVVYTSPNHAKGDRDGCSFMAERANTVVVTLMDNGEPMTFVDNTPMAAMRYRASEIQLGTVLTMEYAHPKTIRNSPELRELFRAGYSAWGVKA